LSSEDFWARAWTPSMPRGTTLAITARGFWAVSVITGGVCTRSGGRRRGLGRGNCAGELGGRSMFVLGAKSG